MTGVVERADARIDTIVREHVIRGQDPRDPQASKNGIKTRVYGLGLVCLWAPIAVASVVPVSLAVGGAVGWVVALPIMRSVIATINDVGDEWTRREDRIRARAIPERDGPDGGAT